MIAADHSIDELLVGIDDTLIDPCFQPVVDVRRGLVVGYEVLSRGPTPHSNPQALFARAREIGVLWQLEHACLISSLKSIAALPLSVRTSSLFFLNVSPDVLQDPRFDTLLTPVTLQEYGIRRTNLIVEITEDCLATDLAALARTASRLTREGCRIALDDFGAGSNGLLTVVHCRPHFLKIDIDLIRNVESDDFRQKIIRATVVLAGTIGATAIAEGVETAEEMEMLRSLGIEYAQGFYFGHPARLVANCDLVA